MTVAAPAVCPSMKMAAFTAQTKATMVMIAASPATQSGLALKRRTRIKTSTANGTAISEMPSWPGKPTIWSISAGNSGVRMPEMMPPAATIRRLLREVSAEVIALANVQLHFVASLDADLPVLAVRKNLFDILPAVEHPHAGRQPPRAPVVAMEWDGPWAP